MHYYEYENQMSYVGQSVIRDSYVRQSVMCDIYARQSVACDIYVTSI